MADAAQFEIFVQGVSVWNAWRAENSDADIDLSHLTLPLHRRLFGPDRSGPICLAGVRLLEAAFQFADLRAADFRGAILPGADFSYARLQGADFSGADLSRVCFDGADLEGAVFSEATVTGAILCRARNLSQNQLETAIGDDQTALPAPLSAPQSWKMRGPEHARRPCNDVGGKQHRKTDLYRLFGAAPEATRAEIRKAYHAAAKAFHPDIQPGDPAIAEAFAALSNAANILLDSRLRESCDRKQIAALGNLPLSHPVSRNRSSHASVFAIFLGAGLLAGASAVGIFVWPGIQTSTKVSVKALGVAQSPKLAEHRDQRRLFARSANRSDEQAGEDRKYSTGGGAYRRRALKSYLTGDLDSAIADFDRALSFDRYDVRTLINRANAWDEKGNPDRALEGYNTAIVLDPKNGAVFYNRAIAWRHKGSIDLAKALKYDPANARALEILDRAYRLVGFDRMAKLDRRSQTLANGAPLRVREKASGADGSEAFQHLNLADPE